MLPRDRVSPRVVEASWTEKHNYEKLKYRLPKEFDSKTFKGILDINPYEHDPIVVKREYVGHVQKRMGARLGKAKKGNKVIGGKGKLTERLSMNYLYAMAWQFVEIQIQLKT